jgi:hypothetical protein
MLWLIPLSLALVAARTAFCSGSKLPNPYLDIPRNNPFRLLAPVVLPPIMEPEAPPDQRIRLTGISTVGGRACALLEVERKGSGEIRRPILQEKEEFADIKLLGIDPEAGAVFLRVGRKTEKLMISPANERDSAALSRSITPPRPAK